VEGADDLEIEAEEHRAEVTDAVPDVAERIDFADTSIDLSMLQTQPAEPALDLAAAAPACAAAGAGRSHAALEDEQVKVIGDLRIGIPLFNIYLNEADELSRRLCVELAEWAMESERPLHESTAALAHSLAGSSATVGYADLSALARSLEHALMRSIAVGRATPGSRSCSTTPPKRSAACCTSLPPASCAACRHR
jgi:chemosensory pili system protein ChpA (sensor histidine kinase/response regulator)